jgi:aminoglycoside phosphotransferase (APT) family kinase protein
MPHDAIIASLVRLGLVGSQEAVRLTPLAGGVSSDIHLVQVGQRRFCVKRALARLKVAAVWEVPLGRNAAEAAWLRVVGKWLPHAVPEILSEDAELGLFAMSFLPPEQNPVWKAELLAGHIDPGFAAAVGSHLGIIHSMSAANPQISSRFANDETFDAIRIEPYLLATGQAHPTLDARFKALAATTLATRKALVHGDVSPKNILCGEHGPVFLDAECAWYGDPAFDLAFCLNHFLLKGARKGVERHDYLRAFLSFEAAYLAKVDWEDPLVLEARAAALLPCLLLARIDGKSPVEYLSTEAERNAVRRFAVPLIAQPSARVGDIAELWRLAR